MRSGNQGYKVSELKPLINQEFFKTFKLKLDDNDVDDDDGGEELTVNEVCFGFFVIHCRFYICVFNHLFRLLYLK